MSSETLAKMVIYGSVEQLAGMVRYMPDQLNKIDEYGYTPLIQTAIVNDVAKAQVLLAAGAEVDLPDLTGRTALYWAADNQNLELCRLLLAHHADANAYSSGGQPVLVMPMMKGARDIVELLLQHGAKLSFAQDFLNAKLMGHSFELEGRIDILSTRNTYIEVELEGFYLQFTVAIMANMLNEFCNHFAARTYKKDSEYFTIIYNALRNASKLLEKQNYLINIKHYQQQIDHWLSANPLILPIAFDGHAIVLIKMDNYLIRCDRGAFGAEYGAVIFYRINHPSGFDRQLCRDLLYRRQGREFVNKSLIERLQLQQEMVLELPLQVTGNCSWANVEAILPSLLLALKLKKNGINRINGVNRVDEINRVNGVFGNAPLATNRSVRGATGRLSSNAAASQADIAQLKEEVLTFYRYWQSWYRERELSFCIQSMDSAEIGRQIAKAALLAAILVQNCNAQATGDRAKIARILKVLNNPRFAPALGCYVRVLSKQPHHPLWRNLQTTLESGGVNMAMLV